MLGVTLTLIRAFEGAVGKGTAGSLAHASHLGGTGGKAPRRTTFGLVIFATYFLGRCLYQQRVT